MLGDLFSFAKELKDLFALSQSISERTYKAQWLFLWMRDMKFNDSSPRLYHDFFFALEDTILQATMLHSKMGLALDNIKLMANKVVTITEKEANLIEAIMNKDIRLVQQLLNSGMNPNYYEDKDRISPLHFAAIYNVKDALPVMIKAGADLYARDAEGYTPFDIAISLGHKEIAMILDQHMQRCNSALSTTN